MKRNVKNPDPPRARHQTMTSDQFRHWRKSLGLKQKDAADRLGLKKRMIQYYEKGDRDGRPVEIPKSVRLACFAISSGIGDFDGSGIFPLNEVDLTAPQTDTRPCEQEP